MANSTVISLILKAKDEASSVLSSTAAKVTALITAFAGGVAIKESVSRLTELDAVAKRLNLSMEELTAAQYAAFQGANVGPEQLSDALDEVRIKIEEFSSIGSGGAVDFFEVLNVDAAQFAKLNPLDQLMKIAEELDGISDASAFTFLDQIGSDALRNLLPVLKNGGVEMRRLMEDAKRLGLTLSDEETIGVNQLNKSFLQLGKVGSTAFDKVLAGMAPQLAAVAETITESIVGIAKDTEGPIKGIGDRFSDVISGMVGAVGFVGRIKDTIDTVFAGISSVALFFVELFITGLGTVDKGFVSFGNGVINVCRSAFSTAIGIFNSVFVKPVLDFTRAFNMDEMTAKLEGFQSRVQSFQASSGKPVELFKTENLEPALEAVRKLREAANKMGMDNANQVFNPDLIKSLDDFEKRYKENVLKNRDDIDRESAKRQEKSQDGVIAKLQTKNLEAAAKITETQARLQAERAKLEIESATKTIETRSQIELSGLAARARAENLSASQVADMRLKIELETAQKIAEQRKKVIDQDIKVLQAGLAGQQKLLAGTKNLNDLPGIQAEIAKYEADIAIKKSEQVAIGAELINQSALLKAERAAEIDQLKEQLQTIRESAEIELRALGGDEVGAEFMRIQREFEDTIRDMEAMGEDSTAIRNLVDARKAKAEMDEVERQYASLKDKLENNRISPLDYLKEAKKLEERGSAAAARTGNSDDVTKMSNAAKAARAEVFDLQTSISEIGGSIEGSLSGLFTDFISGTKSAKEAFGDFAESVVTGILKIIAQMTAQLAVQSMLTAFGGGANAGASAGGLLSGIFHNGGVIGSGGGRARQVNSMLFAGALKYHTGGVIGLAPNEVPIIAEKGEEMLTASDPRHRNNLGKSGGSEQSNQNISIYNTIDTDSFAKAMESDAGSKVIMNVVRANKNELSY